MEKLTLTGLAEKLATLTEEMSELRQENAGLREKVAELATTAKENVSGLIHREDEKAQKPVALAFEGAMSRRSLFSKAGAAAVAATAAGMLLVPREAKAAENFYEGVGVFTDNGGGNNDTYIGYKYAAVRATHNAQDGVIGTTKNSNSVGVRGVAGGSSGTGVRGNGKGAFPAVDGRNPDAGGRGVFGFGDKGVQGDSNRTNGIGVFGTSIAQSGGRGVFGYAEFGYGGQFAGGRAQLYLQPVARVGPPTSGSHKKGEIVMDSNASIWVCISSGTPGSWNLVSTYQPGGD